MYFIYMLQCSDSSLYTGITTDIKRRFAEHISKDKKSAKYTKSHNVTKIEVLWETDGRSNASKIERFIKNLSKCKKEKLIKNPEALHVLLGSEIVCRVSETQTYKIL